MSTQSFDSILCFLLIWVTFPIYLLGNVNEHDYGCKPTRQWITYQYDGLSRLASATRGSLNATNDAIVENGGTLGPLVMAFVCDGQGRVIQKRGLIPPTGQSQGAGFGGHGGIGFGGNPPPNYAEDYYYDGVRRVQDVVTIGTTTMLDREYVYGPGDVNEVLFQFDAQSYVNYLHHDANLNVVALSLDAGVLVEQFSYSPYGELLNVETIGGGTPKNKIGFQGMFFDRLTTQPTQSHMVAGATGLYRTPNRSYSPTLGRWLQRDPNANGQLIIETVAFDGQGLSPIGSRTDINSHYLDALNTYQLENSNPVNRHDPLGLSAHDFDWHAEAIEIVAFSAGERAAFAQELLRFGDGVAKGVAWTAFQVAASAFIPGAGVIFAAAGVYSSAKSLYEDGFSWGNAFAMGLSLFGGVGEGAKLVGKFAIATKAASLRYSDDAGRIAASAQPHVIKISRSRWPEAAKHIDDAHAAGHPSILTIDRAGSSTRRGAAMRGHSRVSGMDREEYPPAVFLEGGTGASVRPIDLGHNRGAQVRPLLIKSMAYLTELRF